MDEIPSSGFVKSTGSIAIETKYSSQIVVIMISAFSSFVLMEG
jgi:hypothetical protein